MEDLKAHDSLHVYPVSAGKAERMLGWLAMLYGLALLNPTQVFVTYYPFHIMQGIGTELIWGTVIFMVGFTQLVAWGRRSVTARLIAAWISMVMWSSIAILLGVGGVRDVHSFLSWYTSLTGPGCVLAFLWAYFQGEIQAELRLRRQ